MHIFFYNAFIALLSLGIRIASLWNKKAALWISGRKNITVSAPGGPCVWMHCASLGEFEQGRPVIEKIRSVYPAYKIIVTFFSPSGFEIRKNYTQADAVYYLPVDTAENAKKFIGIIQPSLVIWIKYDYWFHYLNTLHQKQIPILLVSGIFRESQPFFKWYGHLWRKMLGLFSHLFVQNERSVQLLGDIGKHNATISGDTRFDRVTDIAKQFNGIDGIEKFCGNSRVIVAGSTWEEDEAQLVHFVKSRPDIKFIIVPHEISTTHVTDLTKKFKNSILFSGFQPDDHQHVQVLIIDNIGMLSRLYKYASIAYIGGGFNSSGIHNILEAAVYGIPVVFGPEYAKFEEAKALIELLGAFSFSNAPQLEKILNELLNDVNFLKKSGMVAGNYVSANRGATEKIIHHIAEKRLLTN